MFPVIYCTQFIATCRWPLHQYKIGFTDVVKRPTAGGNELCAADYREWAPVLKQKLEQYAPGVAWFHGKQATPGAYCSSFFLNSGRSAYTHKMEELKTLPDYLRPGLDIVSIGLNPSLPIRQKHFS